MYGVRLVSGLLLLAVIGCSAPPAAPAKTVAAPTAAAASGKAIKLGVRTALSGSVAKQGQEVLHSVELAVEEWNAKGGIDGAKIEVMSVDDASNPSQSSTVSEKLCADGDVLGVVGSFQSAAGIPSSEVLAKCNLAYVAAGETNPQLTDRNLANVNRVCPRDDDQGPALAMYAKDTMGVKKLFGLDDQSTGGKGAADEFEKKAKSLGMEIQRGAIKVGDKDFRAILSTIPKDVDAIAFFGFAPEGALIAKQMRELGYKQPLLGIDPLYEPEDFVKASGGSAEGAAVSFVGPDIRSTPAAEGYVKAFEAKWGPVSSYGPQAYEAANIILTGIQNAGSQDRVAVRDAVRQTKDYKGILGIPISFDAKGDIAGGTIFIFRVKDDKFVQDKMISTRS
jgi:branched-chain amino acid transport system substrate-binding protein